MGKYAMMAAVGVLATVWVSRVSSGGNATMEQEHKAEIMKHIHSIFEAYLRQDRDALRATHTADWTGFQGPSTKIERGIEDYMVNAERSLQNLQGTGYEILDTEIQLYGEMALVYYVARYDFRRKQQGSGSMMLRSLDVYRLDKSGWTQCGSHITPIPQGGLWGENGNGQ